MIKKIDAFVTGYFPIVVAAYFIYQNSFFATHIFMVCWLSMAINMTFSLETYDTLLTTKNSLLSIGSLLFFGSLAVGGMISIDGFLLSVIIGENTALIIAIIIAFVYTGGTNAKDAWKTLGYKEILGFILLFGATIYPYVGEWILYLADNFELTVVFGAITSFFVNVSRKNKTLERIMDRRFKIQTGTLGEKIDKEKESAKMSMATVNILVSLGIWFFGVGIIYAIFVHNA